MAKLLTPLLEIIRPSQLKNSVDFFNRIKNINVKDKLLVSLDIQSLYTYIPVKKTNDIFKRHLEKLKILSPYPFSKLFKLANFVPIIASLSMINSFINRNLDYQWDLPLMVF